MILITSMGGCASTSFIAWSQKRVNCNCAVNSEGIRNKGPGSNPKGLKHRKSPPTQNDPYLFRKNSFSRTDLNEGPIQRAVFLYDNPYSMTLSLFRRKIAMGHAMAVTGKKPNHGNDLNNFLRLREDSFGFYDQFNAWSQKNSRIDYPIMLVNFNSMWENIDHILGFMGIDLSNKKAFLRKNQRQNRFASLDQVDKNALMEIYKELDDKMNAFPGVKIV